MSRDDLLAQARLIAMGFQEEHVHRGTSCVGFDLNALLSWLFEHPDGGATPAEQASAAASKASAANARRKGPASKATKATKVDAGKGNSGVISSALRNHGHGALAGIAVSGGVGGPGGAGWGGAGVVPGAGKDGGGGAAGVGVGGGGPATVAAAAAKAEEKRRHNLELRRINRAWNASLPLRRAEEEVGLGQAVWVWVPTRTGGEKSGGNGEREGDRGRQGREAQTHGIPEGRGGGGDGCSPGTADAAHQTHAASRGSAAAAAERVPPPRRGGGSGSEQQSSASLAQPAAAR
ncbi:unnamed protein product [Ectocarpus fasciculatus]